MLILTRRLGECIRVGHDIRLTVLGVTGNQIRLGIEAPKNLSVHREEIYQRIHKNSREKRDRFKNVFSSILGNWTKTK